MMDPYAQFKLMRKITAPARRIATANEGMEEYGKEHPIHKQIIIVMDNGYRAGENYIKKKASELTRVIGMYGDDVMMMLNTYNKVKKNGNISNGSGLRTTPESTDRRKRI